MEKSTHSTSAISREQSRVAVSIVRLIVTSLLLIALVYVTLPRSVRTETASQPSYRTATFSAGTDPSAAKIGDLDGDGLNDIAVVNTSGNLQLFFNNGAGSFDRVSLNGLWPANSRILDVDIGDLNNDGRNDIAVASSTQTGAISILLNQGHRAFAPPVNYDTCISSNGVVIGDLDRDGSNDMADISQCSKAAVLLNNGQGAFTRSGQYGDGRGSRSVRLGDFNRDGFNDIAYVNNGLYYVTVLINNRNGTFGAPSFYYAGDFPDDLTVGDFDGDGGLDIAIANAYYSEVFILFNRGSGSFNAGYSELYGGDTPSRIASGDFNGDGLLDLAVTSSATGFVSVLINRGDYSFAGPFTVGVGQNPVSVAVGKLDLDSLPDLVVVNQGSGSITVYFSSAGPPPPPPPPTPITLSVSTRTTRTARLVDLRWSGATGSSVDIFRNGSRIATVSNSGSYTDQFDKRAKGTFSYKVCVAGAQQCSNQPAISF